jgi:hypothetical protein
MNIVPYCTPHVHKATFLVDADVCGMNNADMFASVGTGNTMAITWNDYTPINSVYVVSFDGDEVCIDVVSRKAVVQSNNVQVTSLGEYICVVEPVETTVYERLRASKKSITKKDELMVTLYATHIIEKRTEIDKIHCIPI